MEHSVVIQKLTDSVKDIFAFSLSRLYNKQDAEDLTNDIIVEVLSSAERLRNDDAFYGYMWTIADNTFKRFIRSKKIKESEYHADFQGVYWDTPESKMLEDADLIVLRRELSLLSKQYRDVTVKYYIENKSCTAISKELDISEEMVKYYLFKTRKILKEGVTMDRKYGEKSYNPGKFYPNFWGGGNNGYIWHTFERRLPGNIVLVAYEKPMSVEEMSLELGVSAPYLEDELDILLKYNFMRMTGNKYQTNFLIFKRSFEEACQNTIPSAEICMETVLQIKKQVDMLLPKFKKMDLGIKLNDNQLKWFIVNFVMIDALGEFEDNAQKKYGPYPRLNATTVGLVWGHDSDDFFLRHFHGIYGHVENREHTAWYTAVNYNVIRRCQLWQGGDMRRTQVICDGILKTSNQDEETVAQLIREGMLVVENGILKAKFPTFTTRQAYYMRQRLREAIDATLECMDKICTMASAICKKNTPKHLQDRCERLVSVYYQADAMGIIVEKLVADGYLTVPEKRTNLCVFGVKRCSVTNTK